MRKVLYIGLISIFISCSESLTEQKAKEVQLINAELFHGTLLLEDFIEHRMNTIRYQIQEMGNPPERVDEFDELNSYVLEQLRSSQTLRGLTNDLFDLAGGFGMQEPYLYEWKREVTNKDIPLDSLMGDGSVSMNVTILMLELHKRQYQLLKETAGRIPEVDSEYYCEIFLTSVSDSSQEEVKIWSEFVMPLDSMEVNSRINHTSNGKLLFSKEEWNALNVKTIGIPLRDTVLTYYLQYN